MNQLSQSFFAENTVEVAKDLLGKIIDVNGIQGRIVETEAYTTDKASHAYTKTERSKLMYDTHGYVYVYFIYGMYWCLNFTTEKEKPGAVLIRAVEPLKKIDLMKQRRGTTDITNLCSGPGKLCQAFNITQAFNGKPVGKELKLFDDGFQGTIAASSRIGIKDALHLQWRFFLKDNRFVSK